MKIILGILLVLGVSCSSTNQKVESTATTDETEIQAPAEPLKKRKTKKQKSAVVTPPQEESEPLAEEKREDPYLGVKEAIKNANWQGLEGEAQKILEQNNQNIIALNALGMAHFYQGRPLAAKYFLNKALSINPNSSDVKNNLAYVAKKEGRSRQAIILWRQVATAGGSSSKIAYENLINEFTFAKDYKKVVGAADSLGSQNVTSVATLNSLALAAIVKSEFDEAEKLLNQALEKENNNEALLINMAILQLDFKKNLDQGRRYLDRISFLGVQSNRRDIVTRLEAVAQSLTNQGEVK